MLRALPRITSSTDTGTSSQIGHSRGPSMAQTLDTAFLQAHDPDQHASLAIGAVAIVEGTAPDRERLKGLLAERIQPITRCTQLLRAHPRNQEWIDCPDFDLAHHVRRVAIPAPRRRGRAVAGHRLRPGTAPRSGPPTVGVLGHRGTEGQPLGDPDEDPSRPARRQLGRPSDQQAVRRRRRRHLRQYPCGQAGFITARRQAGLARRAVVGFVGRGQPHRRHARRDVAGRVHRGRHHLAALQHGAGPHRRRRQRLPQVRCQRQRRRARRHHRGIPHGAARPRRGAARGLVAHLGADAGPLGDALAPARRARRPGAAVADGAHPVERPSRPGRPGRPASWSRRSASCQRCCAPTSYNCSPACRSAPS